MAYISRYSAERRNKKGGEGRKDGVPRRGFLCLNVGGRFSSLEEKGLEGGRPARGTEGESGPTNPKKTTFLSHRFSTRGVHSRPADIFILFYHNSGDKTPGPAKADSDKSARYTLRRTFHPDTVLTRPAPLLLFATRAAVPSR